MVSCKMNPTFSEIDFYDYKIRMCTIDDTKMYLVSDLLRQYNEKHGTNKRFAKYLENNQSQEVIEHMAKRVQNTGGRNSYPQVKDGQNEQTQELLRKQCENTGGPNSDLQAKEGQNEHSTEIGTISAEDGKWDIPHVIQCVTMSTTFGGANKGYIVCEELLHACLMWVDPVFACDVYSFLTRLREQDNDYLRKENEYLKKRYIPNDQQWFYILSYNFKGDKVHLYSNYCRLDRMDNVIRENERKGQEEIYHLTSIPNGFAFRYMGYEDIMTVIKEYDGSPVGNQRAHFVVPRDKWDGKDIKKDIRWMLQRRRRLLGWRTDLDKEEDKE